MNARAPPHRCAPSSNLILVAAPAAAMPPESAIFQLSSGKLETEI